MIEPKSLKFSDWLRMNGREATLVTRGFQGEYSYLYCGDQKINLTATVPDEDDTDTSVSDRLTERGISRFDPKRDVTLRGHLMVRMVPDTDCYVVSFLENRKVKYPQAVLLWTASIQAENQQVH